MKPKYQIKQLIKYMVDGKAVIGEITSIEFFESSIKYHVYVGDHACTGECMESEVVSSYSLDLTRKRRTKAKKTFDVMI